MAFIPTKFLLVFINSALVTLVLYSLYLKCIKHRKEIFSLIKVGKIKVLYFFKKWTFYIFGYRDVARRSLYILVAIVISYFVIKFSGGGFTQDILSNYLVAIGAMTGGTIAIVFTISLFLLQSAASFYSSQYLEIYIHDWREKTVYFSVILITLILLGGGLFIGGLVTIDGAPISVNITNPMVFISLILIGVVFALIDWQYKIVLQKISPTEAITFLEGEGKNFISKVHHEAKKAIEVVKTMDGSLSDSDAFAISFNHIFESNYLDRRLENLVEISSKLADKREIQTTKRCYVAISAILSAFFDVKKECSSASYVPDTFMVMKSDSQELLDKSFERINKTGERFIKDGMESIASYIVDIIYGSLARKVRVIEFKQPGVDNPILSQIASYLNVYAEIGEKAKNIEVVFQTSRVLGEIGVIAAEEGHSLIVFGIQDDLFERAQFGLAEKQMIIVDQCITGLIAIVRAAFINEKMLFSYESDKSIRKLASLTLLINGLVKAKYLPNEYTTQVSLSRIFDNLYSTLADIANNYFEIKDESKKKSYRRTIGAMLKDVNLTLRQLAEQLKESDGFLMNSLGGFIFHTNAMIVTLLTEKDFEESEICRWLEANIHLPFWFVHHSEKIKAGDLPFNELTDSVAKTGILIYVKLKNKDLLKESVDSINSIAEEALKKAEVDEPRVMKKACYLGILALKQGWHDVVLPLSIKILDFDSKYAIKYPALKNQLYQEVSAWRGEFEYEKMNGVHGLMDSAQDMMYPLIEEEDIDRFIFSVWGIIEENSNIEAELLEKELKEASN